MEAEKENTKRKISPRTTKITISPKTFFIFIIIILAIIAYLVNRSQIKIPNTDSLSSPKPKISNQQDYYAVFLVNDQVYFGNLEKPTSQFLELSNIYYLQYSNQALQQAKDENDKTKLELVKLGNELHGPEDKMYINRDQIIFWEKLKPDSKVVQTIINDIQTNQSNQ